MEPQRLRPRSHHRRVKEATGLEEVATIYKTFITKSTINEAVKTQFLNVCKEKYIDLVQEQVKSGRDSVELCLVIEETFNSLWRPQVFKKTDTGFELLHVQKTKKTSEDNKPQLYDITNVLPVSSKDSDSSKPVAVSVSSTNKSYMEKLLDLEDPHVTFTVLEKQPFRAVEEAMVSLTKSAYNILLVLHVGYLLILFCLPGYFYIQCYAQCVIIKNNPAACKALENIYDPNICPLNELRSTLLELRKPPSVQTVSLYVLAVSDPLIIFVFYWAKLILGEERRSEDRRSANDLCPPLKLITWFASNLFRLAFESLPYLLATIYLALVITCQVLHYTDLEAYVYVYAMAAILGWLYCIPLTRGLEVTRYLWNVIYNMLVKDVYPYCVVNFILTLGFGFAFHACLSLLRYRKYYAWLPGTWFNVFNLLYGRAELFDDDFYDALFKTFNTAEGEQRPFAFFVKFLYLVYVILAACLLINMLIAMIGVSYQESLTNQKLQWRQEDLKTSMRMIKKCPWLLRLVLSRKEREDLRISVPSDSNQTRRSDKGDDSLTTTSPNDRDVHKKLLQLKLQLQNVENRLDELQKMETRLDSIVELLNKKK